MASEITHVFGMLGTRRVIQIGNCGALAEGLEAGDLFVALKAYCGEGAAQYYTRGSWVEATASLVEQAAARSTGRRGAIYTTAALLAESMEDLTRWSAEGFAAVDMETATTYAVAEHFGMERIAVLYAFDNPLRREHLLLSDSEKDLRRAAGNERMIDIALALATE
jgi:purine-nucleoside phosphorylase